MFDCVGDFLDEWLGPLIVGVIALLLCGVVWCVWHEVTRLDQCVRAEQGPPIYVYLGGVMLPVEQWYCVDERAVP